MSGTSDLPYVELKEQGNQRYWCWDLGQSQGEMTGNVEGAGEGASDVPRTQGKVRTLFCVTMRFTNNSKENPLSPQKKHTPSPLSCKVHFHRLWILARLWGRDWFWDIYLPKISTLPPHFLIRDNGKTNCIPQGTEGEVKFEAWYHTCPYKAQGILSTSSLLFLL